LRGLASRESPEFDAQGFPVRRGEVVGFDLTADQIGRAKSLGFDVASDKHLKSLDVRIVRMRAPATMTADDAVKVLKADDSSATYDFDHFYGVNGYEDSGLRTRATAPARHGALWIGMIDTGVAKHVALRGVKVDARDFSLNAARTDIPRKHGTAVASILAQRGAGRITSANIFTADGKPYAAADTIAAALDWLVGQGAPVINISLAGPRNAMLDRVVQRALAKGHLIVAAAGNGGPAAAPAYPAAIPGVIAATAVDGNGRIYRYANQGDYVFVAAPGVGVAAASIDGKIATFSGTSFAAPVVAASLASCGSRARNAVAGACIDRLRREARDVGAPGRDPVYGYGVIGR
jgi:Subtilase family